MTQRGAVTRREHQRHQEEQAADAARFLTMTAEMRINLCCTGCLRKVEVGEQFSLGSYGGAHHEPTCQPREVQ